MISHSFRRPRSKTVFTLVLTPTSEQKKEGGTKETSPLLLALANRGDAGALAAFLGQTLDKRVHILLSTTLIHGALLWDKKKGLR